ncbi:MAG: hypothetical protein ACRDO9_00200 [Gaiellales bacterium]
MELRGVARSHRRRQAQDALQFERDREAALREQLEETVTELEGPNVDEETFARMAPEDVDIVRQTLSEMGDAFEPGVDGEADEDWLAEFMQGESPEVDREERLEEVARLEEEIEDSKRRQQGLERYLEALAPPEA